MSRDHGRILLSSFLTLVATTLAAQTVRVEAPVAAAASPYGRDLPRPAAAAPAAERVATAPAAPTAALTPSAFSTLPFASFCVQPYPNVNRAISTDSAGNIFVVALCSGTVEMTTSTDQGSSWAPTVVVAGGASNVVVEGGTLPGHAIVAWFDGSSVLARTTTNFGATFSPASVIFTGRPMSPSQGLDAVAEGTFYHVMCVDNISVFPADALTRRSPNRGATWLPEVDVPTPWVYGDLLHDADNGNLEVVSDDPSVYRSASTDGGATYSPYAPLPGNCCIYYSDWAMACGSQVYATGNSDFGTDLIWRWDFAAGPVFVEQDNSLPYCIPQSRSVDGDDLGNAFTVGTNANDSSIELFRWVAGLPGVDPPLLVTPAGNDPHVRACGMDTAYVTYKDLASNRLEFERFCFSGVCCAPGNCSAPPSDPTCDAGGPYFRQCAGAFTQVQLDGTGSSDPGGLTLTYDWTTDCPGGSFDDPSSPTPRLLVSSSEPCPLDCTVTLTVSNGQGSSTCSEPVTIDDTMAPSIVGGAIASCHPSAGAASAAALAATTATDACDPSVTKIAAVTGTCSAQVRVTATDDCGNSSFVDYSTRIDGEPPAVTPGTIAACYPTVAAAEAAAIAATTATDNCPGLIAKTASTTGTCDVTISVVVRDSCGNENAVRYRTRVDDTAPSLTRGSIAGCYPTQAAAEAAAIAATTATDNCPGSVALGATTSGTCSATITVTGTDSCGNSASVTYTTRIDGTAPTLTRGSISSCYPTQAAAEAAALAATTATDDCPGSVALVAATSGNCSATITVTGRDACGNSASVTYTTRIDGTPPVLTRGTIAACYPTAADAEVAALAATGGTDNCPGSITRGASTSGTCNATVTVTWTDGCGNAASVAYSTRIDSQSPVVTRGTIAACYPTTAAAEAAAIAATTATDDCPSTLTFSASTAGTCSAVVTVTVRDGCGNAASTTYSTRVDSTPPVLTAGSIGSCYRTVAEAEAAALAATTATDNCPAPLAFSVSTSGTCDARVTVRASDACGNAASVVYATRIDNEPPVIAPSGGALACLWPPNHKMVAVSIADIAPSITDNCPGAITWSVVGCASSQPDNGLGDGNTEEDCVVSPDGRTILARAERAGGDPAGRDYAVLVVATDSCGNTSAPATAGVIHVPHDSAPGERCPR